MHVQSLQNYYLDSVKINMQICDGLVAVFVVVLSSLVSCPRPDTTLLELGCSLNLVKVYLFIDAVYEQAGIFISILCIFFL